MCVFVVVLRKDNSQYRGSSGTRTARTACEKGGGIGYNFSTSNEADTVCNDAAGQDVTLSKVEDLKIEDGSSVALLEVDAKVLMDELFS